MLAERGVEVDLDRLDLGRSRGLRTAPARRHGRRVPARIGRHAAHAGGGEADRLRGHHRPGLALPAGPDGQHPGFRRAQERPRADRPTRTRCSRTCSSETYGIFVYQEQVMEAAQVLAGYSASARPICCAGRWARRSRPRWMPSAQRFVAGCERVNGIPAAKANELFDLIDKFAGYGFNKCHAAAYALLAYQTAWLKPHHPVEFYAASMCFDMHQTDKLAVFVDDMRRMGVALPAARRSTRARPSSRSSRPRRAMPSATRSARSKGVGEKAMEQLVEERAARTGRSEASTTFRRMPPGRDEPPPDRKPRRRRRVRWLEPNRAKVLANADLLLSAAEAATRERESGQHGLFGGEDTTQPSLRLAEAEPWTRAEQMAAERENFGFYFAAHPVESYRAVATANGARSYASLMESGVAGGGRQAGGDGGAGRRRQQGPHAPGRRVHPRATSPTARASSPPRASRKAWSTASSAGPPTALACCSTSSSMRRAPTNRRASPCAARGRWPKSATPRACC